MAAAEMINMAASPPKVSPTMVGDIETPPRTEQESLEEATIENLVTSSSVSTKSVTCTVPYKEPLESQQQMTAINPSSSLLSQRNTVTDYEMTEEEDCTNCSTKMIILCALGITIVLYALAEKVASYAPSDDILIEYDPP